MKLTKTLAMLSAFLMSTMSMPLDGLAAMPVGAPAARDSQIEIPAMTEATEATETTEATEVPAETAPATEPFTGEQETLPEGTDYGDPVIDKICYRLDADHAGMAGGRLFEVGYLTAQSEVEGLPVTEILPGAFRNDLYLKGIMLPLTLTTIGSNAFAGAERLKCLHIPAGVTSIGEGAMQGCYALQYVVIENPACVIAESAIGNETDGSFSGVIYGQPGSTAEAFAAARGCEFRDIAEAPAEWTTDPEEATKGLRYQLCTDYAEIVQCDADAESVTVPAVIEGLPVTRISTKAFAGCTSLVSLTLPEGLTDIGEEAFSGCTGLTELTVPGTVTAIGKAAFAGCTSLKTIALPDQLETLGTGAFRDCAALQSLAVPAGITTLGSEVCKDCTSLTTLTLPAGMTTIDTSACTGCTSLTSVTFPATLQSIEANAFLGCTALPAVELPAGAQSIGSRAFFGCTALKQVSVPATVSQIGGEAFEDTAWLEASREATPLVVVNAILIDGRTIVGRCTVPENVTTIGDSAFYGNTTLLGITIPAGVTMIERAAFDGCTSLQTVTLPETVETISYRAFSGCAGLTDMIIRGKNCKFLGGSETLNNDGQSFTGTIYAPTGSYAQYYAQTNSYACKELSEAPAAPEEPVSDYNLRFTVYDDYAAVSGCDSDDPTSILIPAEYQGKPVTAILSRAFENCTQLASVELPDSLRRIGNSAFRNTALTRLVVPDGVTGIEPHAFENCTALTTAHLPDSVTELGMSTFGGCTALTRVRLPRTMSVVPEKLFYGCTALAAADLPSTVTYIGKYAFAGCEGLTAVNLPGGLNIIEEGAFSKSGLTYANIPRSVISLGEDAFCGCASLSYVIVWNPDCRIPDSKSLVTNTDASGYAFSGILYGEAGSTVQDYAVSHARSFGLLRDALLPEPAAVTVPFSGACGDFISWTYRDGTLTLTGGGEMYDFMAGGMPWEIYRKEITALSIGDGIETIGSHAFSRLEKLTKIRLPDSVQRIGEEAFSECEALTEIRLSTSLTDFGAHAFAATPWLEAQRAENPVVVLNGIVIDGAAAEGHIVIPETASGIAPSAFAGARALTSIVLPVGVTQIGEHAFLSCEKLTSVAIQDPACVIADDAAVICNENTGTPVYTGVIKGYADSTAQAYAEKYGRDFVTLSGTPGQLVYGDADGDLVTDHNDFLYMGACWEKGTLSSLPAGCDLDQDGTVDEADMAILHAYVHNSFEIYEKPPFTDIPQFDTGTMRLSVTGADLYDAPAEMVDLAVNVRYNRMPARLLRMKIAYDERMTLESFKPLGRVDGLFVRRTEGENSCEMLVYNMGAVESTDDVVSLRFRTELTGDPVYALEITEAGSWNKYGVSIYDMACEGATLRFPESAEHAVLGDLTGDGQINASDAARLLTAAAKAGATGEDILTAAQKAAADVNRDTKVDASDAALILMYSASVGTGYTGTMEDFLTDRKK